MLCDCCHSQRIVVTVDRRTGETEGPRWQCQALRLAMGDSSNDCGSSMGLVPYSEHEMANRKTQTEKIKRRGGLGTKTAPRSWAPPHSSHSRRRSRPGRRHSIPSHVMGATRMVLLSWCDPSPTKKTQIIGRSVSLRLMAWHVPNAGCSYCVSWVDTKQGLVGAPRPVWHGQIPA